MENIDFFSKAIDFKGSLPFYQAWSRAYKKVGPLKSIASNQEKSGARGAKKGRFCMGILVTLSLSKKKAPIGLEIFFSTYRRLFLLKLKVTKIPIQNGPFSAP